MNGAGPSLASIQVLRAAAAIAVVVTHARIPPTELYGISRDTYSIFTIGGAGVDLFFVISGFVMVYASEALFGSAGSTRTFWLRRAVRIAPIYWIAGALAVFTLLRHAADPIAAFGSNAAAFAATFLFFPYPGVGIPDIAPIVPGGWTINYEMFFYVIFGLFLFLPRRACVASVALVLCGAVALGAATHPTTPALHFWTDPIVLEFVLGMLVGAVFREGVRLSLVPAALLLAFGAGAFVTMALTGWARFPRWIEFGVPSAAIVAAVTFGPLTAGKGILWRVVTFVGDASYSLYLFHFIALGLTRRALGPILPWLSPTSYFATSIVLAILGGAAAYVLVERPMTRWLNRVLSLRSRSAPLPNLSVSASPQLAAVPASGRPDAPKLK